MLIRRHSLLLATSLLALGGGCKKKDDSSNRDPSQTKGGDTAQNSQQRKRGQQQWFHATVETPGGRLPFYLGLGPLQGEAVVRIGSVDHPGTAAAGKSEELVVELSPRHNSEIRAKRRPDGSLSGTWSLGVGTAFAWSFPFAADPVGEPDPRQLWGDNPSKETINGRWRVAFSDDELAVLTCESPAPGIAHCSFNEATMSFGQLVGTVSQNELVLGNFDGVHAHIMRINRHPSDGSLSGELFMWSKGPRKFTAKPADKDFKPYDPKLLAPMERNTVKGIPLLEPYVQGPLIIEIGGTWCPACSEVLPTLREAQNAYKLEGLRVLSLYLELTSPEEAKTQVAKFKSAHKVPWQMIPLADLEEYQDKLPGFPQPNSLPIVIFVYPGGTVHSTYSGFRLAASPASDRALEAEAVKELASEITHSKGQ